MKWAERCFGSLRNSSVPNDVFVVDNGSTDGTQEFIEKNYPEIILHQSAENLGFGKANNVGLQYALDNDYDYVYLLNQDAWVKEDTFQNMIAAHTENKQYGILSPIQIEANMQHLDKNFLTIVCGQGKHIVEKKLLQKEDNIAEIDMTMAAHWLISRECLVKVGGFSPAFPHYNEDDNLADRAIYHGFRNGIVLNAYGVHDREYRKENTSRKIYEVYINAIMGVSFIHRKANHPILYFIYSSLKTFLRYRNFQTIRYCLTFFMDLKQIKRCREKSKGQCAFLTLT